DSDEVLGPMFDAGDVVNFSIEPYHWMAVPGGGLPSSTESTQFTLSKIFTPEGARNLRAIIMAYQDGNDYGKISILQVPKGEFVVSPEQAEAIIDQDPDISQQFQQFSRNGTLVVRGHMSALVV